MKNHVFGVSNDVKQGVILRPALFVLIYGHAGAQKVLDRLFKCTVHLWLPAVGPTCTLSK